MTCWPTWGAIRLKASDWNGVAIGYLLRGRDDGDDVGGDQRRGAGARERDADLARAEARPVRSRERDAGRGAEGRDVLRDGEGEGDVDVTRRDVARNDGVLENADVVGVNVVA